MAYLEQETLTCPVCRTAAPVDWVIGEGPNTGPGEGPAYIGATNSPDWRAEPAGPGTRLYCRACGALAAERHPPPPGPDT